MAGGNQLAVAAFGNVQRLDLAGAEFPEADHEQTSR